MRLSFQRLLINIPFIGIILFFCIYLYATQIYKGGTHVDLNAVGFDWINNYWCDLLGEIGRNGEYNPAALPSKVAMIVLTGSLVVFFYLFPIHIKTTKFWRNVIPISGILSMIIAVFIATKWHDWVIVFSGTFGFITLVGVFVALARNKFKRQLWFGVFALFLMGINNYLYFVLEFYDYLPLLQKVTFIIVLWWIISVNRLFVLIKE